MAQTVPLFLKTESLSVLVVGGGQVGLRKARYFTDWGAKVTVLALKTVGQLDELAKRRQIDVIIRHFRKGDCKGFGLVVAATDDPETNQRIREDAHRFGALFNAVDEPEACDFFLGATARRGDLTVAVSTNGKAPALSVKLKKMLESGVLEGPWEELLAEIAKWRGKLKETSDVEYRQEKLRQLISSEAVEAYLEGDPEPLRALMRT